MRRRSSAIIIPARLQSTRLPRKLLLRETGKTVLQHTYEAACKARRPLAAYVATDSEEIANEVRSFGGRVELTSPSCTSGTERVAEAALRLPTVDVVVNVQGDEPEVSPDAIDLAVSLLDDAPSAVVSTLAAPIHARSQLFDPACVKVVFDQRMRALYFSRAPIPYPRTWDESFLVADPPVFYQHIGVYAYRREFLRQFTSMRAAIHEQVEVLEQLRILDAGFEVLVGVVRAPTISIDTADDYRSFVKRWRERIP